MKTYRLSISYLLLFLGIMSGACGTLQVGVDGAQVESGALVPTLASDPSQTAAADVFTPAPLVLESTPVQPSVNDTAELFSSEGLGICFSYPRGYTQIESAGVLIAAPDLPGSDVEGLFWVEISDSNNRSAGEVADQDMTYAASMDVGRWAVELDGEQAVVLDGMPGQALQRRVYVVHQQTLYVLGFWPARSENTPAGDQMEALYAAVTTSWEWSPCSASE